MGTEYFRIKTQLLKNLLLENVEHPNVILIEGARQVGKTTLVLQVLRQLGLPSLCLNLEKEPQNRFAIDQCQNFKEFEEWLSDEHQFKPDGTKILFIDEAQESRQLGHFVRSMKEDWNYTKTILTGSMMSRIFRDDVRYPVGRVTRLHVQPFTFFEFLQAKGKEEWIQQLKNLSLNEISPLRHERFLKEFNLYIHIGGLPSVIKCHLEGREVEPILKEIYANYRADFIRVFGEDSGYLFNKVLQATADHVGSPSKFSQAFSSNEPSYRQLGPIYSRLESWHMILLSPQRGNVPEGSTDFHPKRYLFDMGILNLLRTIGIPDLNLLKTLDPIHRKILGGFLENVLAFYLTYWNYLLSGWKLHSSGMEIDFVTKINGETVPIECKLALMAKETHLKGLKLYMQRYGLKKGIMVHAAPFTKKTYPFGTIYCLPFYAIESLPDIIRTTLSH